MRNPFCSLLHNNYCAFAVHVHTVVHECLLMVLQFDTEGVDIYKHTTIIVHMHCDSTDCQCTLPHACIHQVFKLDSLYLFCLEARLSVNNNTCDYS